MNKILDNFENSKKLDCFLLSYVDLQLYFEIILKSNKICHEKNLKN